MYTEMIAEVEAAVINGYTHMVKLLISNGEISPPDLSSLLFIADRRYNMPAIF